MLPDGGPKQLSNKGAEGHVFKHCRKCGAIRHDAGIGLEHTHDCSGWARGENCGTCYVCHMRLFAAECRRVLRDNGTLWINIGDSYAGSGKASGQILENMTDKQASNAGSLIFRKTPIAAGLKPKDLSGIPWRVALALQSDG